jgi:YidC/Oxa1 family membrane protein insertase
VAQLPVFIGLFYMLRKNLRPDICPKTQQAFQHQYALAHHVSLHAAAGQTTACGPNGGAGFLFINDLTNKATGITLVVLLVLYVGTQLASSLMMANATMDKTQRNMMLLLPLFFVVIVINFPAGLIVYWITTNTWTMLQQYVVRRRIGPIRPAVATAGGPAGSGGGGPGGGGAGGGGPGGGGRDGGTPPAAPNGSGGGLAGLLRGRLKDEEKEPAGVGASGRARRETAPPPPPRKKKKRSGRRR